MKKKQWAQSFSLIDEKYVEEADPMRDAGRVSAVRRLRRRIITLAACAAAVLLGLILFIPYRTEVPDVSRYADSEYYAVIQRLNDGQVIKPRYRNNLDYLLSKTLSKTDGDMNFATGGTGTAKGGEARPETGAYRETTDNQVAGIVEGDLLKRTDTRIYYADVDSAMLRVYSVMGEDSALLGSFDLTQVTVYPCEMYLSADGRSVTLLCNGNGGNNQSMILLLDVTDPAAIRVTKQVSLSGTLVTSRLTGNGRTLLVVTSSRAGRRQDYSDPLSFVPGINRGDGQGMRPLTADCITVPAEMSGTQYSTLTALHAETLDVLDTRSVLAGELDAVYVNAGTVYLAWRYTATETVGADIVTRLRTGILGIAYDDEGLTVRGSVALDGYLRNQYCMDERDGILRVVTGTEKGRYPAAALVGQNNAGFVSSLNANLYCVSLAADGWQAATVVGGYETLQQKDIDG